MIQDELIDEEIIPFTICQNIVIQDENLSYEAVGIFIYLKSKPKDWKVIVKHLQKRNNTSEYSVRKALRELRDAGYIKWERVQSGFKYYISAVGKYKTEKLHCGDSHYNESHCGDSHYNESQHNIYIQKKEVTKERSNKKEIQTLASEPSLSKEVFFKEKGFTENEVRLISEYLTERKKAHKKLKDTERSYLLLANQLKEVKEKFPLEVVFAKENGIYKHIIKASGDVWQLIKVEYLKNLQTPPKDTQTAQIDDKKKQEAQEGRRKKIFWDIKKEFEGRMDSEYLKNNGYELWVKDGCPKITEIQKQWIKDPNSVKYNI